MLTLLHKRDRQDLRRTLASNFEFEMQLAKARAAHRSVRSDSREGRAASLQVVMIDRAAGMAASGERHAELEEALTQAFDRLKAVDVALETQAGRMAELEKAGLDSMGEAQKLKLQVSIIILFSIYVVLKVRCRFGLTRCRPALRTSKRRPLTKRSLPFVMNTISSSRNKRTGINSPAPLSRMSCSRIPSITRTLMIPSSSNTVSSATRTKSSRVITQHRFKDQENEATSNERTMTATKQSISQAQQRPAGEGG